jgi:Rhomboid family
MLLARQRLIPSCGQLLHSRITYGSPKIFPHHRFPATRITAIHVRLKSRHRNSSAGKERPRANGTIKYPSSSTPNLLSPYQISKFQPIRPGKKKEAEVFEQLTSKSQVIFDFVNWRYSRLFLAIVLNSAAMAIYCVWLFEAYRSSRAKEAVKRGDTVDPSRGRFVMQANGEERFLTPGQEWLLDNFTLTPINFREGRYWTVVTSLFSHQLPMHVAFNMVTCHLMCTSLCPAVGTIPVAMAFFIGGISCNLMTVLWQGKRGGKSFDEKYPGQFFGSLGMSGANHALMGFGATAVPNWFVTVMGVWNIRVGHIVIGAWLWEAFQYWRQEGWEKIQSLVIAFLL